MLIPMCPPGNIAINKSGLTGGGISSYISYTASAVLPTAETQKIAISYWQKPVTIPVIGSGYLLNTTTSFPSFNVLWDTSIFPMAIFAKTSVTVFDLRFLTYLSQIPFAVSGDWLNVVIIVDTTQATLADRVKYYRDGILQVWTTTECLQNEIINSLNVANKLFKLAEFSSSVYLGEMLVIRGQDVAIENFGFVKGGVWSYRPYRGSYGLNGIKINWNKADVFADGLVDKSGNGFTINLTGFASASVSTDIPPQ